MERSNLPDVFPAPQHARVSLSQLTAARRSLCQSLPICRSWRGKDLLVKDLSTKISQEFVGVMFGFYAYSAGN